MDSAWTVAILEHAFQTRPGNWRVSRAADTVLVRGQLGGFNGRHLARAQRAIRRRQVMTQQELSAAAGVSRSKISALENGRLDRLTLTELERCFGALDATLALGVRWHAAGSACPTARSPACGSCHLPKR